MQTRRSTPQIVTGTDQRLLPSDGAGLVLNMRYHPDGYYIADRGWEPRIPVDLLDHLTLPDFLPTRYVKCWRRGGEEWYLQESGGDLFYMRSNSTSALRKVSLKTGRNIPGPDSPGTDSLDCGRYLLIYNGVDKPFKFWGGRRTTDFGLSKPRAPHLYGVETAYMVAIDAYKSTGALDDTVCPAIPTNPYIGLGNTSIGSVSTFLVRYSFVGEDGSQGPLSDWALASWTVGAVGAALLKYGMVVDSLDQGGTNVIGRDLYRTMNLGTGSTSDSTYETSSWFFADRIHDKTTETFMFLAPDSSLSLFAPSEQDSIEFPMWDFTSAAIHNDCLWIAGGKSNPTRVFRSVPGKYEQYQSDGFVDLAASAGSSTGRVVSIQSFHDSLIVFCTDSIHHISKDQLGKYHSAKIIAITSRSPKAIRYVPGVGMFFLAQGGIYLIVRGASGSFPFEVRQVGQKVQREVDRLSACALQRAWAEYSPRERELWINFPVDGMTEPMCGVVFHLDSGEWSIRRVDDSQWSSHKYRMAFSAATINEDGWFVLGTSPWNETTDKCGDDSALPAADDLVSNVGLQIWSGNPFSGKSMATWTNSQGNYSSGLIADLSKMKSFWSSPWLVWGVGEIHAPIEVIVSMLETGLNPVVFESGYDHDEATLVTEQSIIPIYKYDDVADKVYGSLPGSVGEVATLNSSKWIRSRLQAHTVSVEPRFCQSYRFWLSSSQIMAVISYRIGMNQSGTRNQVKEGE